MARFYRWLAPVVVGLVPLLAPACGSDDDRPPNVCASGCGATGGSGGSGALGTGGSVDGSAGGDAGDAGGAAATGGAGGSAGRDAGGSAGSDAGGNAGMDAGDAGDATVAKNCGELSCQLHEKCVSNGTTAECQCDDGYISQAGDCVVDESCVNVRFLEPFCRQQVNGAPAVGLFFALDYCAGTPVILPDTSNLNSLFSITEGAAPVLGNPESFAQIIKKDVENYVTLGIDVSASVTASGSQYVAQLTAALKVFVQKLKDSDNTADVGMSLWVFGLNVQERVPFTTNLDTVLAELDALAANPQSFTTDVGGDGTALFDMVESGIRATERIQNLRRIVSDGGRLSTGTLVVVTDGRDESNRSVPSTLIDQTVVNTISIGISDAIDDAALSAIGRDGSILVAEPADWSAAFDEIATRVEQAPDRTYLLAYCSSASQGEPTVSISYSAASQGTSASCKFNADWFSGNPGDSCPDLIANACTGQQCGGLFACGACADSECCSDGICQGPAAATACNGQNELCDPASQVCASDNTCVAPVTTAADCTTTPCKPGESYCVSNTCVAVNADGAGCAEARECPTQNCRRRKLNNDLQPLICFERPARMFDECSTQGAKAVCESGAQCGSTVCEARSIYGCRQNQDCASGLCVNNTVCAAGGCYFSWDQKMAL